MSTTRTPVLNRTALVSRCTLGALAIYASHMGTAQAMTPNGVGIYLDTTIGGTYGYVGNGGARYASGPGITINDGGGTQSSGGPLYAMTSAPLALGATAGTISSMGTSGAGAPNEAAQAAATADLSSGVLRVNAKGTARGIAEAEMQDRLTFQVAGGGTRDITVTAHLDGHFSFLDPNYASGSQQMRLSFGSATFYELGGATDTNGLSSYHGHSGPSNNVPPGGWLSYSFSNETPTGFDFTGIVQVSDGERSSLTLDLLTDCSEANCAFDHTGRMGLDLPSDVSFTSDSGVFLSAGAAPVAAVPEPQTWALMLGGIGLIGALGRRRAAF